MDDFRKEKLNTQNKNVAVLNKTQAGFKHVSPKTHLYENFSFTMHV